MSERHDAIIIGAGIIGAAVGLELARKGWRCLNLDRNPAAGYGSTSSSAAVIRTHYSTLDGTAMAWEAYHAWRDWPAHVGAADERGLVEFRETGCLAMHSPEEMAPVLAHLDALGIRWEAWGPAEIRRRLPGVDLRRFGPPRRPDDPAFGAPGGDGIEAAVFMPQAGYVPDPQLATHNLQRGAEALGGRFRFNAEVAEVLREGGRVAGVRLADGEVLEAPVLVNAAGPFSARVNAMAGVLDDMAIGTRAQRQELAQVPAPAALEVGRLGIVVTDADVGCYYRPEGSAGLLIGSHDPECDEPVWIERPDSLDRSLSEQGRTQVLRVGQRLPELPVTAPSRGVVDMYDVSDDWIPIYDRSGLPGYYMAIGTSGNQFKNGPVAGLAMAELIAACEAGHDHDREPVRFTYPRTGVTANLGFFSRNRPINRDSSFSVMG